MLKIFTQLLKNKSTQQHAKQKIALQVSYKKTQTTIEGKPGENIMRLLSKFGNEKFEVFGLCDCQLACTTCSVHLKEKYQILFDQPNDEEMDILCTLKEFYPEQTRMACQLHIPKTEVFEQNNLNELDDKGRYIIEIQLPSQINYTSDIYGKN